MSSMETITVKLESLQARLLAENKSHEELMETAPNRQKGKMILPIVSSIPREETETDRKLKKIMKQTGILTINGRQYATDIKDLEHLGDLGNGTSGNVVKMCHVPSGTIIAVKQMRRTGNTEENKRILMDLDVVLKSHDCPYIVQCLGCFVRDPDVWICMELMSMCFDKLLKLSKKPVPEDILGKVTVATVKALSYLKEKHGVIHRDVKPSNILIDERGNIKLCDFGISGRLVDSKANTRSAGCAAYMAPERIDPKKPKYDIRADVWSLGITLVELATARSPYEGCNTDFEVLTKVLDSEPPRLPLGEGFNFSPEFYDFVNKCLTKNYNYRPKYPELLEQPFIKKYELAQVDVPKWFQSVVETAGIKTHHRTIMPKTSQDPTIPTTIIKPNSKNSNLTTMPSAGRIATTNAKIHTQTMIPSYQQQHNHYHNQHTSFRRDENHHQPTQLPQPIGSGSNNSSTIGYHYNGSHQLYGTIDCNASGNGIVGNGSGSSSATSSSPQSPPSVGISPQYSNRDDRDGGSISGNGNERGKLYQKSPYMQRKFGNSNAPTTLKYSGQESPKKETVPTTSMLSSIGQSIIRNLTTSPFSQKKQSVPQTNQIDPLWRIPTDVAAFDDYDASKVAKPYTNSPFLGRKRIPTVDEKIIAAATGSISPPSTIRERDYLQHATTLIPNNRHETVSSPQQRLHGSHSPIVLQRFYHQQNQLREKEFERVAQHNRPHSPDRQTNPFLSNYQGNRTITTTTTVPTATKLTTTTTSNFHYNNYYTHIPIATAGAASTSSHSTSSQSSSTLSTSSQVASVPTIPSLTTDTTDIIAPATLSPQNPPSAFGVGSAGGQLQYQPLPQQYLRLHSARNSRSPPTSPEQLSDPIVGVSSGGTTGNVASKLSKFYARRHLQSASGGGNVSNSSNNRFGFGSDIVMGASKESNSKDDQGWFNSLAGAMKRQFASYAKMQLNSSASTTSSDVRTVSPPASSNGVVDATASIVGKSSLPYYQRSASLAGSSSESSNVSNSLSPTEALPRAGMDGSTGGFLRRYAATGGAIGRIGGDFTGATAANAHILAGLDRRHRSPDPPPRYNRGQSPLLLRKNLLELSGQPPGGSPMLNRRYVTASPPLPPPRRGSESVPGSPQHFRTRIHYTPEPQRRIYRTIDQ